MSTRANRAAAERGVELTKFTKVGGPLTKRISLTPDGKLVSHGSACVMSHGTAERVRIAGIGELATLIGTLRPNQAIALGALRAGLPDKVEVVTEKKLNGVVRPDIIARTAPASHIRDRRSRCWTLTPRACRPMSRLSSNDSGASGRP